MKHVLDTNTLSFLMAGHRDVTEQLLRRDRTDVLLPQPVAAEIAYGIARLPRSRQKARLEQRFASFLEELPRATWTDAVSQAFGRIKANLERQGQRLEDLDIAVAAHALALNATLVTDNLKHLKRIEGLRVTNWRMRPPAEKEPDLLS